MLIQLKEVQQVTFKDPLTGMERCHLVFLARSLSDGTEVSFTLELGSIGRIESKSGSEELTLSVRWALSATPHPLKISRDNPSGKD